MRMLIASALVIVMSLAASAQLFDVVGTSGVVTAVAEIKRGRLLIQESTGERIDYAREPRYDSTNGRYLGYYNFTLNRVLRFPRSGIGVMFTADLDDAVPRFRATVRTVQPRAGQPVNPIPPGGWYPDAPPSYPDEVYPPIGVPPLYGPPLPGPPLATSQSVLIDTEIVPLAPLPPVTVQLFNSGRRELQIALIGLASGIADQNFRLAPGETRAIKLQRDSGGERVDYYRVVSPYGETFTKQISTPVPAESLYEVVVHEWAMQSVAIDRTGKSPDVIEDINFQGKGIGRFILPPGAELTSTTIDVLQAAQAAGNRGAVAPLVPADASLDRDPRDPLERAVLEALDQQRRAQQRAR